MTRLKKKKTEKPLTQVELELMSLLWRIGEGTVADVMAALPAERKLAYTSISTMLRILESKKRVRARKEGRGHVYVPALSKDHYEATSLKLLVNQVFDGAPLSLVKRLLDQRSLSQDDLEEIRRLLDERLET